MGFLMCFLSVLQKPWLTCFADHGLLKSKTFNWIASQLTSKGEEETRVSQCLWSCVLKHGLKCGC